MPILVARKSTTAPAPTYDQWQVFIIGCVPTSGVTNPQIALIEMAATPGGPNLCTGGTVISSGAWSGLNPPSNAFDGNLATYAAWNIDASSAGIVASIGYQFATPVSIGEIRLWASTTPDTMVQAFVVGRGTGGTYTYSDITMSLSAWSSNEERDFTVPTFATSYTQSTARIWGITRSGFNDIGNVFFRAVSGGATLATGGTNMDDNETNGTVPGRYLWDSNDGTRWLPAGTASSSAWYVFPTAPDPAYMALQAFGAGGGAGAPSAWTVWWSPDGINRTTALTVTGQTGWALGETREFAIP